MRPGPDLYDPNCSSRTVLDAIGGKWPILVLCALDGAPRRTSELQRIIGGISTKMLHQTLRDLTGRGLLSRTDHGEKPLRVEYELTELGASLAATLKHLERWVVDNWDELRPGSGVRAVPRTPWWSAAGTKQR